MKCESQELTHEKLHTYLLHTVYNHVESKQRVCNS